ncbi:MAG: anaerobic ribonucleoside-triphosphate reductase activating protein [Ruminococcus sp.]|nr:anaerobic ribonucleoside-triphosphate reductase activating protein [Ruminococcus sp.]MCM1478765.1 anaerobic ribonucleoside-triphosphate reductase activating protein [Muribaculaceae bacterium]
MNYIKIDKCSVSNGQGVRVVLWVSGCTLNCPNCHNPQTWDFNSGIPFTFDTMNELLEALDKSYISGLTLSGGHPLESENLATIYGIVYTIKEKLPNKTIWLYTGYTWDSIISFINNPIKQPNDKYDRLMWDIISNIDILVDGEYIDKLRDITLPFRGSSNQRIIDVKKMLKMYDINSATSRDTENWNGKIILWEQPYK